MPDYPERRLRVIEAPSNLGLMPPSPGHEPGTRNAPDTIRELGLHSMLNQPPVARVEAPAYDADDGRTINIRNLDAIRAHAIRLADAVEDTLKAGAFPLVLGGDCSILVGSSLGVRRRGEAGLLFIDGHTDFYLPEQSGTGGAAGMDLALACGWGPELLTNIENLGPYIDINRVAAMGNRDYAQRPDAPIPHIGSTGAYYRSLDALRAEGIEATAAAAIQKIDENQSGYWIHLDVDVLDDTVMPAVDSPQAGGLSHEELERLLQVALAGNALGMQVTIYDPERDPGYHAGRALVELLSRVLGALQMK